MKNRNIADSIWGDPGFSNLSLNAKLIWFWCLTNPNLNLIGIFHALDLVISAYTGLGRDAVLRCLDELTQAGMIVMAHGYIIICNYAKYNCYEGGKLLRGVQLAFQALPDEVFYVAVKTPRIKSLYLSCLTENLTMDEMVRSDNIQYGYEPEQIVIESVAPPTPKPVKAKIAPTEAQLSELGQVFLDEANRMLELVEDSQVNRPTNKKCNLTASECEKLAEIVKAGCGSISPEKLARQLVREFYGWKFTADRSVKSDYLSMIKPWVMEKAQKHFANPNFQNQEPERIAPVNMTDKQRDEARDRTQRAKPDMLDTRIGKKWGEMNETEIDEMIQKRIYDVNGARIKQ